MSSALGIPVQLGNRIRTLLIGPAALRLLRGQVNLKLGYT